MKRVSKSTKKSRGAQARGVRYGKARKGGR